MSRDAADAEVPTEVDPTTPSVARVFDYFLDGRQHFPVDEAATRGRTAGS